VVEGPLPSVGINIQDPGGHHVGCVPPVRLSQVRQHLIQCSGVDRGVHPAGTVRGYLTELVLQAGNQAIVGVVTLGDLIKVLIVAQPQGDVPGRPVCPSVVIGALRNHGGECLHWSFVCCVYCRGSGGSEAGGVDGFQTVCFGFAGFLIHDTFQGLAAVDEFVDESHDVLLTGQVTIDLHQELLSVFLLPSYHALSTQAAMMNGDRSSAQQGLLIQHEAVDLLSEAGTLLLS
jgi:hypothetical protein